VSRSRMTGANRLRRKLQRLPDHIQKPVKTTLERGANVMYADTLKNVPVDEGDLAKSLHKAKRSSGMKWIVGWWKKGNARNWKLAGWRAHFSEFGTEKSPAQPMLGPAFRNNQRWISGQIKAAVNRALRQAGRL